ncbi:MAG: hypothetical protein C4575_12785 [Desulforudis sp.]|nr:MAG: hypothetical protein C4575_12785 [Desulforudis sp.]
MTAPAMVIPVVQQVSNALCSSEDFAELLACLPDSFFYQGEETQKSGWMTILHLVVHGERDFEKIASAVKGAL